MFCSSLQYFTDWMMFPPNGAESCVSQKKLNTPAVKTEWSSNTVTESRNTTVFKDSHGCITECILYAKQVFKLLLSVTFTHLL